MNSTDIKQRRKVQPLASFNFSSCSKGNSKTFTFIGNVLEKILWFKTICHPLLLSMCPLVYFKKSASAIFETYALRITAIKQRNHKYLQYFGVPTLYCTRSKQFKQTSSEYGFIINIRFKTFVQKSKLWNAFTTIL